jgi:hypothetical protein
MRRGTFRSFIAGLVFSLVLYSSAPAGPIAEAVGKGWDKVAGKIVKVHEAAESLKPKGKLIKGVTRKVKQMQAGGCCHSK